MMKVKFFEKTKPNPMPGLHRIGSGICLGLVLGLGGGQKLSEVRYFSSDKKIPVYLISSHLTLVNTFFKEKSQLAKSTTSSNYLQSHLVHPF